MVRKRKSDSKRKLLRSMRNASNFSDDSSNSLSLKFQDELSEEPETTESREFDQLEYEEEEDELGGEEYEEEERIPDKPKTPDKGAQNEVKPLGTLQRLLSNDTQGDMATVDEYERKIEYLKAIRNGDYDPMFITAFRCNHFDLRQLTSGISCNHNNSVFHRLAAFCDLPGNDDDIAHEISQTFMFNRRQIRDRFDECECCDGKNHYTASLTDVPPVEAKAVDRQGDKPTLKLQHIKKVYLPRYMQEKLRKPPPYRDPQSNTAHPSNLSANIQKKPSQPPPKKPSQQPPKQSSKSAQSPTSKPPPKPPAQPPPKQPPPKQPPPKQPPPKQPPPKQPPPKQPPPKQPPKPPPKNEPVKSKGPSEKKESNTSPKNPSSSGDGDEEEKSSKNKSTEEEDENEIADMKEFEEFEENEDPNMITGELTDAQKEDIIAGKQMQFVCPQCNYHGVTKVQYKLGNCAWASIIGLSMLCLFPCAKKVAKNRNYKDSIHTCPKCSVELGKSKRTLFKHNIHWKDFKKKKFAKRMPTKSLINAFSGSSMNIIGKESILMRRSSKSSRQSTKFESGFQKLFSKFSNEGSVRNSKISQKPDIKRRSILADTDNYDRDVRDSKLKSVVSIKDDKQQPLNRPSVRRKSMSITVPKGRSISKMSSRK